MSGLGRALRLPLRGAADEERGRRIDEVMGLVDRLVFDLGLMAAGETVRVDDYLSPEVARRLRTTLGEASGELTTRPDFGEFAQVRVEGDLIEGDAPVRTVVEFDDRSVRVDRHGQVVSRCRRRIRLRLILDPSLTEVVDLRVELP